jgi:hypothetical protein
MYNITDILCKYLILKVENAICFATTGVSVSASCIYFRGTYGQSIKLAKKPRTLILKIFATVAKNEAFLSSI